MKTGCMRRLTVFARKPVRFPTNPRRPGRWRPRAANVGLAVVVVAAALAGCGSPTDGNAGADAPDAKRSGVVSGAELGKKLLGQMAAAYREAPAYRDRGRLRLVTRSKAGERTENFNYAVEFVRPNRLRIEAYAATVASDGHTIVGKITAPEINDWDNQVVELDAPAQLSVDAIDEFDAALARQVSGPLSWSPVPLGLLLGGEFFAEQFRAAERVAVLPSKEIGGRECHCVQIEDDIGRSEWWIDKENFLLRRFVLPVEELARRAWFGPNGELFIDPSGAPPRGGPPRGINPSEISLVADFTDAAFAAPHDDRFSLAVPETAHRVKYLVPLPPPLPPDGLIGEPSPPFAFDLFSGEKFADKARGKLTVESLRGKAAMLLFWQNREGAAIDAFDALARQSKDRDDVAFVAVLTDPAEAVSDAQLREAMTEKNPAFAVARADHATAAFGLLAPSAAVFLSREGVVEYVVLFDTLGAVQVAPPILDTLLAGKPWHPRAVEQIAQLRREYAERLALAKSGRPPVAEAAPQAPPQRHRLVSLWKQTEIRRPGNIVASPHAGGGLLVLDGPRTVVELDAAGKIGRRHELELPAAGEIGFLRVGRRRDGTTFYVGSRLLLPKLYVFDEQWNVKSTYPEGPVPTDEDNPEVADIQVADLDGDGESEIAVGYAGIHGVHLLSADGDGKWRNYRNVFQISRLAITRMPDGASAILAASFAAPTAVLDARGEERGRWEAQAGPLSVLVAGGSDANSQSPSSAPPAAPFPLLGIAGLGPTQLAVIGLAADGRELWRYSLPLGVYGTQIQAVAWGRLVGDKDHWIVAAPDGSIHLISAEGTLLDGFSVGAITTGIAATTINNQGALVVATREGTVEALRLDAAETIRPEE